ncbi:MAG TPA: helix-turn-helix transcriptional regulator [Croceibacterium sp.]|jgi:DNA-binding XRE family transcriptional regulator
MTAQHIEIAGKPMVLLTREEFERLAEAAENYDDICAAVAAQERRNAGEEYLPIELVDRLMEGENPLKVWRQYRGFSQEALAKIVGRNGSWIAKLEKGKGKGDVTLWRALANALHVDLDDLVPQD